MPLANKRRAVVSDTRSGCLLDHDISKSAIALDRIIRLAAELLSMQSAASKPANEKMPIPCEHCHGTGIIRGIECRECLGRGHRVVVAGRVVRPARQRPGTSRPRPPKANWRSRTPG